jgi:hypothetical protein
VPEAGVGGWFGVGGPRPGEGGEAEAAFRAHVRRHEGLGARLGSAVGDPLVAAAAVALLAGRGRTATRLAAAGFATMVVGHLLTGNLRAELDALARHPLRSLRDEARFVAGPFRERPRPCPG